MSKIVCPAPLPNQKQSHIHCWPPHAVFASAVGVEMTPGSRVGDIVQCKCGQYAKVKFYKDDYGGCIGEAMITRWRAHHIMRKRGCPTPRRPPSRSVRL